MNSDRHTHLRALVILGGIVFIFLLVRGPVAWQQSGGQDEEWYAVPGLMVAEEGVPRVPYARASQEGSVFLGAERMLLAMPPAAFYAQAPFFLALPATYGTARMASLLAGCIAIVTVFGFGREWFADDRVGLWGAGIYSLTRLLFFPATFARPDMLCGMFGLLAVWGVARWTNVRSLRWVVLAGVCLGLAGLSHPFAIVFAMQLFPWVLVVSRGIRERALTFIVLSLTTGLTFASWLPMIVSAPDLFRLQFLNNILAPAGPGLLARLLMPWDSFTHHLPMLIDRTHPIQFAMLLGGWLVFGMMIWRSRRMEAATPMLRDANLRETCGTSGLTCWLLAGSSVYLLIACQGEHPIQGYWCYSAGLFCLCLAAVVVRTVDTFSLSHRTTQTPSPFRRRVANGLALLMIVLAMLPGSGVRTILAYARHAGDLNYQNAAFVASILEDLPVDAQLTVGIEFALEAYGIRSAAGRPDDIILGIRHPLYFDSTRIPTNYAILGRLALAEQLDDAFNGELVSTYGDPDDEFSCYAEVYRIR
ncbi:MAG: glycosyltransferase family 39 protein [Planctomycetaceae bacterium]|nr:glycosyltransferase family 39 protein [Planctomycetaceae bacterium]